MRNANANAIDEAGLGIQGGRHGAAFRISSPRR
jgi:hypothetical protein